MKEPVWIRTIEALAFHSQQIALFGGSDGVRDAGLLDSALARPRNLFVYSEATVTMADLAAAYAFGISSNHPFVDGNKRTAMQDKLFAKIVQEVTNSDGRLAWAPSSVTIINVPSTSPTPALPSMALRRATPS